MLIVADVRDKGRMRDFRSAQQRGRDRGWEGEGEGEWDECRSARQGAKVASTRLSRVPRPVTTCHASTRTDHDRHLILNAVVVHSTYDGATADRRVSIPRHIDFRSAENGKLNSVELHIPQAHD